MDTATCLPGFWYVSFPCILRPDSLPTFGPFDTETQAKDWLESARAVKNGYLWYSFPTSSRATVHDIRSVVRDTTAIPPATRQVCNN